MNCDQFQRWLLTRDVFSNHEPPEAISHLSVCADCKRLYMMDLGLEEHLRSGFPEQEMPKSLADRIDMALDQAKAPLQLNRPLLGVLAALITLTAVLLFFMNPNQSFRYESLDHLGETAVMTHLKGNTAMSFTPDKLDEALAAMRKELEFDVVLPDLPEKGYALLGGRLCFVGKCRTAYLFYRKGGQTVSLFILNSNHLDFKMAEGREAHVEIKDCRADIWKANGQVYALVSSS